MGKNIVIVVALLAAGFFAAYLRFKPHLGIEAAYTDGVRTYDSAFEDDIRFAVWDDPEPLGETVNGDTRELSPAISPDGRFLVFSAGDAGLNADLWVAELDGDEPGEARPLLGLNTDYDELAPAFGSSALYFTTNRPGGEGGLDVWRAEYRDGRFEEPRPLGAGINTAFDESDPAPLPGSRAIAFASDRGSGGWDLYLGKPAADGGFDSEALVGLNSLFDDREPAFTADGLALLFASDRPGADDENPDRAADFDLWRSVYEDGEWLSPNTLVGVNGPADERAPLPSRDGFTLLFSMEEDGRDADLFRAQSRELFRLPGRPVGWLDLVILATLLVAALLAWLAKRWKQLEILYKCFLVSAAAHVALLLWFQHVGVEGGAVELPGRNALFQVRLASVPSSSRATLAERGGALEVGRTETEEAAEPERRTTERASTRVAAAEAATESLERRSAPDAPVPNALEREDPTPTRDASESSTVAQRFADTEAPAPRREGAARALSVAARALDAQRADSPSPSVERGERAAVGARSSAEPTRGASPAFASELLAERAPVAAEVARQDTRLDPAASRGESVARTFDVAVAQPAPGPEVRREAGARALELAAPTTSRPSERAAPAMARTEPSSASAAPRTRSLPTPVRAAPVRIAAERSPSPARPAVRERVQLEPTREAAPLVAMTERIDPAEADRPDEPRPSTGQPKAMVVEAVASAAPGLRRPLPTPEPRRMDQASPRRAELAPRAAPIVAAAAPAADDVAPRAQRLDTTPYRSRFGLAKEEALAEHGGGIETEAAVADGLAYLASIQSRRGYWGPTGAIDDKYFEVAVGKTALAVLAFLGAGHTPDSGTEYSDVVRAGLRFLVSMQDDESGHFGYSASYGHAIATYALAECRALTGDDSLREPLERAVEHILENQYDGPDELTGGWGYYYPDGRTYDNWPRVSVTSWQVMALESAKLSGIEVPARTFARARRFLSGSQDRRGWFRYSHDPSRLRSGYPTLPGSTPAALFALSLLGEDITGRRWRENVGFVTERSPTGYRTTSDDAFVFQASGNLYFWYYGTLALFRHGGPLWERWNASMKDTLLGAQESDGSWRPISVYARYAGDDDADRSYTTAMCVLTLEVYYRYFTPLLKVE